MTDLGFCQVNPDFLVGVVRGNGGIRNGTCRPLSFNFRAVMVHMIQITPLPEAQKIRS